MASLRDRLKRINEVNKDKPQASLENKDEIIDLINLGFKPSGHKVYKKNVILKTLIKTEESLPNAVKILIPDLNKSKLPEVKDFIFFDLETTGLSGGAGTVAFLASFGRIIQPENQSENYCLLHITQYLLLDYPGENDFLLNVLSEFNNKSSVIVSYNGKCFDSQILKTRCLMNRIKPPLYNHVDLLHPARRLWKNIIDNCSQASIESQILNIQRKDDIPGSLAPVIWFDFLKTGKTEMLVKICDHNIYDISGLASILAAMISIAEDPLRPDTIRFDLERFALNWRKYLYIFKDKIKSDNELFISGKKLLCLAAERNHPRAVYIYAYDLIKDGNYKEAYKYVKKGLTLFDKDSQWHEKLLRRKERLEKKL